MSDLSYSLSSLEPERRRRRGQLARGDDCVLGWRVRTNARWDGERAGAWTSRDREIQARGMSWSKSAFNQAADSGMILLLATPAQKPDPAFQVAY